jgi:hypothetical protein
LLGAAVVDEPVAGLAGAALAGAGFPGLVADESVGAEPDPGLDPVDGRAPEGDDPPEADDEEPEPPWPGRPELSRDVLSTTRRS